MEGGAGCAEVTEGDKSLKLDPCLLGGVLCITVTGSLLRSIRSSPSDSPWPQLANPFATYEHTKKYSCLALGGLSTIALIAMVSVYSSKKLCVLDFPSLFYLIVISLIAFSPAPCHSHALPLVFNSVKWR